jgi:hypothetical protein
MEDQPEMNERENHSEKRNLSEKKEVMEEREMEEKNLEDLDSELLGLRKKVDSEVRENQLEEVDLEGDSFDTITCNGLFF